MAINEHHVNAWLEARGQLPPHRTISKARRAALAGCYRLLDPESVGGVDPASMQLVLRALGFAPAVVSSVLASARCDENGRYPPPEFNRLCVEAERTAGRRVSAFESPRVVAEGFPLALLLERERIHDSIARLSSGSTRARPGSYITGHTTTSNG